MKAAAIATTAAALFGGASAQGFRFLAQTYLGTPGEFWGPYETWYGDGHMYVGPGKVPAGLTNTFNYITGDWTSTAPDVRFEGVAPASLPENTFLAINNGTGAREPLVFSNDESALGEDHINQWLRWGTFIVPKGQNADETSTESHFYLEPTEEEDTFRVTWRTPGTPDEGLQKVNITGVL